MSVFVLALLSFITGEASRNFQVQKSSKNLIILLFKKITIICFLCMYNTLADFFRYEFMIMSINCNLFFCFFFYFLFLAPACSQSLHASQNPLPVGSTVTLSSDSSVSSGAWLFNNDIIVMIFGRNKIISDQWKDRVTFNSTSNHTSLAIRSLQVADSGIYTLQALNLFRVQLPLSVQGKTDFITLLCVCLIPLIPLFYEGKSNRAQFTPVIMTTFVLCHG